MGDIERFSGFEVIRAAMEVERNGHRFYSAMAGKARNDFVKEIFTWLAQDEVEHLRRLKELESGFEDGSFFGDDEEFMPYLNRFRDSEIFPSERDLENVLASPEIDLKALDMAIEAEDKFAEYFRKAAGLALSPDGREAFTWLAGEEERHASLLRDRRARLADR